MDKAVFSFVDGRTKLGYAKKRCRHYEKMTAQVDEYELNKAFDKAEEMFGILVGMRALGDLLCDSRFVARVGKENVKAILSKRAGKAIQGVRPMLFMRLGLARRTATAGCILRFLISRSMWKSIGQLFWDR